MALFVVALALTLVIAVPARADYFVWEDPDSGMTVTFPDTWKRQSNQQPDDMLTIQGPASDNAQPVCRVRVRDDKRGLVYPPEYSRSVQKEFVSRAFWKDYLATYDDFNTGPIYEGGLGRGFASYTTASFTRRDGTVHQTRSGILFASLYFDKVYIIDCSTLSEGFGQWVDTFRSIIKSVDFRKAHHERDYGDYANFLHDADTYIWSQPNPVGVAKY